MNGDCDALEADQPSASRSPSYEETKTRGVTSEVAIANGRQASAGSKRKRRRKTRPAPNNSCLLVDSSASRRSKPERSARAPTNGPSNEPKSTDPETGSQFTTTTSTTTSEITTDDDAASIEIRLNQLVVEQEQILGLDERYRSTPVLAHRAPPAQAETNLNGGVNQSGTMAPTGDNSPLFGSKARSTNDLPAVIAGKVGGGDLFNFEHSPTRQVPDVFVIQVDETQESTNNHHDDDYDKFTEAGPRARRAETPINDDASQRTRASSVSGRAPFRPRQESTESDAEAEAHEPGGFMRRNISSSYLPERGDLRNLNSNRAAINELANSATGRNRSNTAGSMDKSALFSIGFDGRTLGDANQSMLSIRRSAWTLSEFDQTFNKSAIADQRKDSDGSAAGGDQQQKILQQYSDTSRGSNASDRQSTSLLIKASKNAMAGQQQQQQLDISPPIKALERRYSLSVNDNSERRPSFSHSIVSVPSSVDSYSQAKLSPRKHKPRPSFSAGPNGTGADEAQDRSCLRGCLNMDTMSRYLPILEWLPKYKLTTFYSDLGAGLAVAALNISTSLSAAVVAETDFGAAFRASIVNTFVYAILCSSKHASFGSWSIMSQMLLLSVKRALNDEYILDRLNMGPSTSWQPEEYEKWHMNIIIMYTFLIGLVQLICGALNLGNILSSFIPEALCSSMIAATAFTMAIGQLANMCGTSNKILWQIERNTTEVWADLKNPPVDITDLFANTFRWIQQILLLIKHYDQINAACVIISIISVILLFLNQYVIQQQLQRLFKRKILIPFEMVLLVVMVLVSYSLNLAENYNVTTCGPISIEFGVPNIPNLRLIRELWYNSLATALISYTMVYIMAKSYSNKLNYEVNYNQELIACGAGNLIGGLFDALPATASFSRTAGQVEAGGQTQMVSIINCVLLVALARLLGEYVSVLPICVMSAALFFGFSRMMTRFMEVFMYWRVCKVDFAIWVVTFVSILAVDMVNGFILGFIFSILTMLYRAQK